MDTKGGDVAHSICNDRTVCRPLDRDFQAAGHPSALLDLPPALISSIIRRPATAWTPPAPNLSNASSGHLLIKPCTMNEAAFYDKVYETKSDLMQCIPRFYGHFEVPKEQLDLVNPKNEGKHVSSQVIADAIVLENLASEFIHPSILDYKLGNILYDPLDASKEKAARMILKAKVTTSLALAGRIAGMKVWDTNLQKYQVYGRDYGRALTVDNISSEGLARFFEPLVKNHGMALRDFYIQSIISQLEDIVHIITKSYIQMRGASVLILYETVSSHVKRIADNGERSPDTPGRTVTCKLIDFAHTRFVSAKEPGDPGVILGLENLIKMMRSLDP